MPTRKKQGVTRPRGRAGPIAAAALGVVLLIWLLSRIPYNVVYDGENVLIVPMAASTLQPEAVSATPQPATPTLTPAAAVALQSEATQTVAPVQPGDVLFEEDFEDGQAETFNYLSQNWQVLADETGNMVLEGDNTPGHDDALGAGFGSVDWTDYAVSYRLRVLNSNGDAWLNFRNTSSWYVQRFSVRFDHLGLYEALDGMWEPLREPNFPAQPNVWYLLRVEAQGEMIRIYVDGQLVIEHAGALVMPGNLTIGGLPGSHLQFDDIKVIALDPGATLSPQAAQARAFADPILAAIEDRPPDFEDDFSNPGSGWQIGTRALQEANRESGEQGYAGGEYFVEAAAAHCNSGGSTALQKMRDIVLEVDGRLTAVRDGDWQVHVRNEYAISIEPGGMVILGGNQQGEAVSLFKYQGPFIRGGIQADHLQIIARGPQLAVFVNGQSAGYLEDPQRVREGDISFAVCSPGDAPLRARWDNLKIWDISDLP